MCAPLPTRRTIYCTTQASQSQTQQLTVSKKTTRYIRDNVDMYLQFTLYLLEDAIVRPTEPTHCSSAATALSGTAASNNHGLRASK